MAHNVADLAATIQTINDLFRKLPDWVGREAVNFYKDSFTRQAYIDRNVEKWAARKNDKKTKRGSRAILVQSGALRRSLRFRISGNTILVYTNIPYAQVHNEGETVTGVRSVGSYQRKKPKKGGKTTVKAHTRTVNYKMPKRQFMDIPNKPISQFLEKRIVMHLGRALEKLKI